MQLCPLQVLLMPSVQRNSVGFPRLVLSLQAVAPAPAPAQTAFTCWCFCLSSLTPFTTITFQFCVTASLSPRLYHTVCVSLSGSTVPAGDKFHMGRDQLALFLDCSFSDMESHTKVNGRLLTVTFEALVLHKTQTYHLVIF